MKLLLIGAGILCIGAFALYKTMVLHIKLRKEAEKNKNVLRDALDEPEAPKMFIGYIVGTTFAVAGFILTLNGLLDL